MESCNTWPFVCGFIHSANVFEAHPCSGTCQSFIPLLKNHLFVVLGLRCYGGLSAVAVRGTVFVALHGGLIAVASLVAEHRLVHGAQ